MLLRTACNNNLSAGAKLGVAISGSEPTTATSPAGRHIDAKPTLAAAAIAKTLTKAHARQWRGVENPNAFDTSALRRSSVSIDCRVDSI